MQNRPAALFEAFVITILAWHSAAQNFKSDKNIGAENQKWWFETWNQIAWKTYERMLTPKLFAYS